MSETPRTQAAANAIGKSGVDWHHSATLMKRHAEELEQELIAMTTPRPYDFYWCQRALAAERKLKAFEQERAAVRTCLQREFDSTLAADEDILDCLATFIDHHKARELSLKASEAIIANKNQIIESLLDGGAAKQKRLTDMAVRARQKKQIPVPADHCDHCGADKVPLTCIGIEGHVIAILCAPCVDEVDNTCRRAGL